MGFLESSYYATFLISIRWYLKIRFLESLGPWKWIYRMDKVIYPINSKNRSIQFLEYKWKRKWNFHLSNYYLSHCGRKKGVSTEGFTWGNTKKILLNWNLSSILLLYVYRVISIIMQSHIFEKDLNFTESKEFTSRTENLFNMTS